MAQHKLLLGTAALAIALSGIATSRADSILVCDNTNNASEMLAVRYIHSPTRALFDISFKAPANKSLEARQELEVRVDGYVVGYATLAARADGSFGASVSFDSYANTGQALDATTVAFPPMWPGLLPPASVGLGVGSRVMIGSLGCTLEE